MNIVLIIDDDPMVLKILSNTLTEKYSRQFKVITANNGKEAVEIIEQTSISLLITDIVMPEMDGLALLAFMNEHYPSTTCFVITGHDTPKIRKQIPKDVLHFFTKPVRPDVLGQEIIAALKESVQHKDQKGISVISFLLMIEIEKKTCIFEALLNNGKKALFYFKEGVLYQAIYDDLKGEEAVVATIAQGKAKFNLKSLPQKSLPRKINKNLEQLILEAKGQQSETVIEQKDIKTIPLKQLNFIGRLKSRQKAILENVVVTNLAKYEIQFKPTQLLDLKPGDLCLLEFTLDDKSRSLITREVYIKTINEQGIIAEFRYKEHYDRLGPYIAFNGFTRETIE